MKFLQSVFFVSMLAAVFFGYKGYDKISNYYNSEFYFENSVNAYVGGDAYNYIINGTYFAGYMALSGAFIISSTLTGLALLEEKEV